MTTTYKFLRVVINSYAKNSPGKMFSKINTYLSVLWKRYVLAWIIDFSSEKFINVILWHPFIHWLPFMKYVAFFPRLKCFFILLLLMIADVVPIPILGLICMFILLFRPPWFKELVDIIYAVEKKKQINNENDLIKLDILL
jgi:hypothetical protein